MIMLLINTVAAQNFTADSARRIGPSIDSSRPRQADPSPFSSTFPDTLAIMVSENTINVKNSGEPKLRANLASTPANFGDNQPELVLTPDAGVSSALHTFFAPSPIGRCAATFAH